MHATETYYLNKIAELEAEVARLRALIEEMGGTA